MLKIFLTILVLTGLKFDLSGQCPDKSVLWNRIIYLRDSSNVSIDDQLREFKIDSQKINNCLNKYDSVYVLLLTRMGWLLSLQKDFKNAILLTNRGIDLIHNYLNKPGISPAHLIKYYNNLQILYDSTGQQKLRNKA
jgi:hypothetical protein